ncbi:MAG TPA: polysaccharide deacetylase family protein [Candidatus Saccharimonadales bacterium]|nr:polysaccharide deacetylase family protein [Candidatus Saccharimonadales bacterium]
MQLRAPRARPWSTLALSFAVLALIAVACSPGPNGTLPPPSSEPSIAPSAATPAPSPSPSGTTTAASAGASGSPSFVPPTPTPQPTFLTYVVVAGDSLLSIARRYDTTGRSVAFWNRAKYPTLDPDSPNYKPNHVEIGWKLNLIPGVTLDEQGSLPTPRLSPFPSVSVPPPPSAAPDGSSVVISNGSRSTHLVALTFDLGGEVPPTLDVLNWLIANDVRATIFATGSAIATPGTGQQAIALVSAHPDLFSVGNLSWDYPSFTGLDAAGIADELARTEGAIFGATGRSSKPFFRPPYGAQDAAVRQAVGKAGWTYTVMWDVDTVDWKATADGGPTGDDIVAKVLSRAQGGSIVLMHLGGFNTLAALPRIVAGLRANGLEPVTLNELLGLP